jgi:hypothetical protein
MDRCVLENQRRREWKKPDLADIQIPRKDTYNTDRPLYGRPRDKKGYVLRHGPQSLGC